ncbi:hypothetical protein [Rhodococcus sp. UFZ-B548]|uniref:hypothetical protein n=1 Tax=Rhodococcus sp. UFZ-B548 TaxID=2742212 RepID=UPI0015F56C88|nr:hypothetical protein [Rhodococcus sp. UFZ-B548]
MGQFMTMREFSVKPTASASLFGKSNKSIHIDLFFGKGISVTLTTNEAADLVMALSDALGESVHLLQEDLRRNESAIREAAEIREDL